MSLFTGLKKKLAERKAPTKKKRSKKKGPKVVTREYYTIEYIDGKGRKRTLTAKSYEEARAKAEKYTDKGYDVKIGTTARKIEIDVDRKKIVKEKLAKGLDRVAANAAKNTARSPLFEAPSGSSPFQSSIFDTPYGFGSSYNSSHTNSRRKKRSSRKKRGR